MITASDRLEQQLEFILEIDKLKKVIRRSYLTDGSRKENDAEASWHLAVMVMVLAEHASHPDTDMLRVLKMVLIHDLVEIYAGDGFLYADDGGAAQATKEEAAADKLFALLPPDQAEEMRTIWNEFEAAVTPEAQFARALDRLQPLLLIHSTEGKTWKEHGVTAEKAMALNPPIIAGGSPTLGEYAIRLLNEARDDGYFAG